MTISDTIPNEASPVFGLILSGGLSTRMENTEKGLVAFNGVPLIQHVLAEMLIDCTHVAISCNSHQKEYAHILSHAIDAFSKAAQISPRLIGKDGLIEDQCTPIAGPVAGIVSGVADIEKRVLFDQHQLKRGTILVTSCDMPLLVNQQYKKLVNLAQKKPHLAHYYASTTTQQQKSPHHFLPAAFNIERAMQLANQWQQLPAHTPRSNFALKNWLSAISAGSSEGVISDHDFPDKHFLSVNSRQQLSHLEAGTTPTDI